MAADGPLGSALVDRVEGACEPVLPLHSGARGQSPRRGARATGPTGGLCNTPGKSGDGLLEGCPSAASPEFFDDPDLGPAFTPPSPHLGLHVVRGAIDWWTTLMLERIDQEVWEELEGYAASDQLLEIPVGEDDPLRLELGMRRWSLVAQGDGLYIEIAKPDAPPSKVHYGVTIQYQGKLLSTGETGLDVIQRLRPWLWFALFPTAGDSREEVVARLQPFTRAGRVDYAVDVAHVTPDAEARIDAWYARESASAVYNRFATHCSARRSSAHANLLGSKAHGRTWTVGSDPKYRIYERDKHTGDGHWEVLKETLKRCGWDSRSPILRAEVQVQRTWQEGQVCDCDSCRAAATEQQLPQTVEGYPVKLWTEDQAIAHASGTALRLFERTRDTADDPLSMLLPAKERPMSPLWEAVVSGTDRIVPRGMDRCVAELRCVQKKLFRERRVKTMLRAVDDLQAVGLTDGSDSSQPHEVWIAAMRADLAAADQFKQEAAEREILQRGPRSPEESKRLDELERSLLRRKRAITSARQRFGHKSLKAPEWHLALVENGVHPGRERLMAAINALGKSPTQEQLALPA